MPIRSPFPKPGTRVSQKNGAGGPENSALVTKFFGWAFFVFVMCLGVAPLVPTIGRNDSAETSFLLLWSRELRILRYLGGSNIDLASTYMHFPTLPLFPFPICAHAQSVGLVLGSYLTHTAIVLPVMHARAAALAARFDMIRMLVQVRPI